MNINREIHLGTVSEATMRNEDLIPTFTQEVLRIDPDNEVGLRIWSTYAEYDETNSDEYFDSEDAGYDLEDLFDELDNLCSDMPYVYFGSTEGDGCDYGFWVDFESLDEAIENEEVVLWVEEDGLTEDLEDDMLVVWTNKKETDWALYRIKDGELSDMIWSV
jgi:hypothetical protein